MYRSIYEVLKNPPYAGAYVYGRRETRIHMEGTEIRKSKGHTLEMRDWNILIKYHHACYISWEEYEKNQEIRKNNNTWTTDRVKSLRIHNRIAAYSSNGEDAIITLKQAAEKLGICAQSIRKLITQKLITAQQVVRYAPWAIPIQEPEKEDVKIAARDIRTGTNRRDQYSRCPNQATVFDNLN